MYKVMKMDIEIFDILYDFVKSNRVSQVEWSKAASVPQPRISELVGLSKANQMGENSKIRRSCTFAKLSALYRGLTLIVGKAVSQKHLMRQLEKEADPMKKLRIHLLILQEAPLEQQEIVETQVSLLIKNFIAE
jgi:hypothetical protein